MHRSPYAKEKSNIFKRIFKSQILWSLLALGFLLLIVFPAIDSKQQRQAIDKEIAEIQQDIENFENSNKELEAMIDYLDSDQSIEEKARLNLGMKKPGEEVVVVKVEGQSDSFSNNNINDLNKNLSNPQRWFRYFFN